MDCRCNCHSHYLRNIALHFDRNGGKTIYIKVKEKAFVYCEGFVYSRMRIILSMSAFLIIISEQATIRSASSGDIFEEIISYP